MKSHASSFLVARPLLRDPNFVRSVILLVQHNEDGAFGLVVNRPAQVEGAPFPVYVGGPCASQGLLMVHGHADWADANPDLPIGEIAPGIFMGNAACMERVQESPEESDLRYRVFVGYSGWGPEQLEDELASGAWFLTPALGDLLFDTPADELWERLSPPSIPQPSVN